MPSNERIWNCPSCSRRVPRDVAECRCGAARPGAPGHSTADAGQRPAVRALLLVVLGLVIGLSLAVPALHRFAGETISPDGTARSGATPHGGPDNVDSNTAGLDSYSRDFSSRGRSSSSASSDGASSNGAASGGIASVGAAGSSSAGGSVTGADDVRDRAGAETSPSGQTSGARAARALPAGSSAPPGSRVEHHGASPTVTPHAASQSASPQAAYTALPAFEDVVARTLPAVASIRAGGSTGTGFFVRFDTVVTNAHVVAGQSAVTLQVGSSVHAATVSRLSDASDLALLTLASPNRSQPTLTLASEAPRVGQEVIAIGSALGVLSNTVTRGIVSAVRRVGQVHLVQTDAAINPGNSGGPLLGRDGRVIGVNSMTVGRQTGEGLAFAVAGEHVTELLASRGPVSGVTPLGGLEQMLRSSTDSGDPRAQGERAYAQRLEALGRQADQLDAYWSRYEASCVVSVPRTGDRPWFGVFDRQGVTISQTSPYNCASWLESVREYAEPIRDAIVKADEQARRDGVYPGVTRDLRTRHRLVWRERN
jgi:S1-C subfamily serine protease